MISAIVLTKNEENNIKQCLKSLSWCDETIVIDDFSNDKTIAIVKTLKTKVYRKKLEGNFAKQRNFGLSKAKGKWILFIDADEVVTQELKKEIISFINNPNPEIKGCCFKRKDKFLGRWLKFGETASVRFTRLAKKNAGKWIKPVHEMWQVKGEKYRFKKPLIHKREVTIDGFLARINLYSSLRAKELYNNKVKTNGFLILIYPIAKFIQNYFFRLGFLDAKPGFVMATMMSIHSFLVRAKLYLLWKNKGKEDPEIPVLEKLYQQYG